MVYASGLEPLRYNVLECGGEDVALIYTRYDGLWATASDEVPWGLLARYRHDGISIWLGAAWGFVEGFGWRYREPGCGVLLLRASRSMWRGWGRDMQEWGWFVF